MLFEYVLFMFPLKQLMKSLNHCLFFGALFFCIPMYAQDTIATNTDTTQIHLSNIAPADTLPPLYIADDDPFAAMLDAQFQALMNDAFICNTDTSCLNIFGFEPTEIPEWDDNTIRERLQLLDAQSPMDLRYNNHVQAFINLYVNRKRELSSRVLGMSDLYFPMIEEKLDMFGIPLEMKHLAIVESALNPRAHSRAGAKGLWQFMYATGKMFDLNVTSYEDDRYNPYDATIAACRYLNSLYNIYGDWNLVLAAYNAGPGNVNKAIRRSGGKKDYWAIRNYLPRETRGYVPAFIAVNYMMNYYREHNIYPVPAPFSYHDTDTLHITDRLTFTQVATYTDVKTEWLELLNPTYKKNVIPATAEKPRVLCLPKESIGVFIVNHDSIKNYTPDPNKAELLASVEEVTEYHRVRSGEFLGSIANRYDVRVRDLMEWNGLRNTNIYPGQNLTIHRSIKHQPAKEVAKSTVTAQASTQTLATPTGKASQNYKYHTVQLGDTLWDIAKKYDGVTVNQLKQLNSGMNFNRLKPGQKIKIQPIG